MTPPLAALRPAQRRKRLHNSGKLTVMPRGLPIVVVVALLAVAGVVEGIRTNRWGDSEDVQAAASKLAGVPREVGTWTSTENQIDEKVLRVARASGHVARNYTNTKTGDSLSVLLLCGPTGDIAAHTPDICYAGSGYKMLGRESKQALAADTYWSARFEKPEATLQVCWAWCTDGNWTAADDARTEFALRPVLFKFYVSRNLPPADRTGRPTANDPIREFLTVFLPEVKKALALAPG